MSWINDQARRLHRYGVMAAMGCLLAAGPAAGAESFKVRMDFSPWGMHAAMHLAVQKGWFEKEGLNVEVEDGTGTINTLQLLAAGRVDVGQVSVGTMAVAMENGLDLKSIAGFARTGDLAVMTDAGQKVASPKDLRGKKIVCFATSPWVPFIDPFLKANGMSRGDVNLVMVSPSAMISTYASGNSDAFMSQAPFGVPMVGRARPATSLLLEDSGISFPSYGLAATPDTIEKRGPALAKFVAVQVRAWQYLYDGHLEEGVQAILARRPNANLDAEVLRGQLEAYRPFFNSPTVKDAPIGRQYDSDWAAAIQSMEQAGMIKPGRKPSDYYTNALLPN